MDSLTGLSGFFQSDNDSISQLKNLSRIAPIDISFSQFKAQNFLNSIFEACMYLCLDTNKVASNPREFHQLWLFVLVNSIMRRGVTFNTISGTEKLRNHVYKWNETILCNVD